MKVISDFQSYVSWEKSKISHPNRETVLVHRVLTRQGPVMLAAVITGVGDADKACIISGYTAKKISEWFYGEFMTLLQLHKSSTMIERSFQRTIAGIQEEIGKVRKACGINITIIYMCRNKYSVYSTGENPCLVIRLRKQGFLQRLMKKKRTHEIGQTVNGTHRRITSETCFVIFSKNIMDEINLRFPEKVLLHDGVWNQKMFERNISEIRGRMNRCNRNETSVVCICKN